MDRSGHDLRHHVDRHRRRGGVDVDRGGLVEVLACDTQEPGGQSFDGGLAIEQAYAGAAQSVPLGHMVPRVRFIRVECIEADHPAVVRVIAAHIGVLIALVEAGHARHGQVERRQHPHGVVSPQSIPVNLTRPPGELVVFFPPHGAFGE